MGRPSKYTPELFEAICQRIETGETLTDICRPEEMPNRSTVHDWIAAHDLSQRFTRARDKGFDAIAESCFAIADDARNDWMERFDDDGAGVGWKLNGDHVQRSKLRIETRLKLLAKWDPKRYGEKIQTEHSGEVGVKSIVREVIDPKGGDA